MKNGDLDLSEFVGGAAPLPYWARRVNGRVVSSYSIWPGLFNVPAYAISRALGVAPETRRERLSLYTASTFAALAVVFLFLALADSGVPARVAFLLSLAAFFGTCLWSVAAKGLFQHGPSACFLALALWMLVRATPRATAAAGLALGLAVVTRPTDLAIALPLAVFVAVERGRALAGFLALAALPAAANAAYAWRYWGSPFSAAQSTYLEKFAGRPLEALAGLLVSPSRGLFVFSPFLILAIPALVAALAPRASGLERAVAVGVLVSLLLYSTWSVWWGGHSFGYRLLIDLVPLLVFLVGRAWKELAAIPGVDAFFAASLGLSVFVQYLGATVYPASGFNEDAERSPELLWSVRDGEIARDWRVLTGRTVPRAASAGPAIPKVPSPSPAWWTAENADETIPGAIDWPRAGAGLRGPLRVVGWAGSFSGRVDVRVAIAPGEWSAEPPRAERDDVCRILPALAECPRVGFGLTVAARPSAARAYSLSVEIRDARGCVRRLGPVPFFWND